MLFSFLFFLIVSFDLYVMFLFWIISTRIGMDTTYLPLTRTTTCDYPGSRSFYVRYGTVRTSRRRPANGELQAGGIGDLYRRKGKDEISKKKERKRKGKIPRVGWETGSSSFVPFIPLTILFFMCCCHFCSAFVIYICLFSVFCSSMALVI